MSEENINENLECENEQNQNQAENTDAENEQKEESDEGKKLENEESQECEKEPNQTDAQNQPAANEAKEENINEENSENASNELIEFKEENAVPYVDYSKLVEEKGALHTNIQNRLEAIQRYNNISAAEVEIFNELIGLIKSYDDLWTKYLFFFQRPPSDEELITRNKMLLSKKILDDLEGIFKNVDEFYKNFDKSSKLKDSAEAFNFKFENFISNQEVKLETVATKYDEFLDSFIKRQNEKLQNLENEYSGHFAKFANHVDALIRKTKKTANILLVSNFILAAILAAFIFLN